MKGTNKGTLTAEDGSYQIWHLAAGEHILIIASVGLQTQEQVITIQAGQTAQLDVTLQETARQLSEVKGL